MKKWGYLLVILLVSITFKYTIMESVHTLPCSDVYFYLDTSNELIASGEIPRGIHPTFHIFLSELSLVSGVDLIPFFFYFAPVLNAILILAVFVAGSRLYNENVGLFSAFFAAITPIIFVRHSQLIAENLVIPLFVLYFLYLWKLLEKCDVRYAIIVIFSFLGMFYAHDLTGGLAILLSLVFIPLRLALRRRYIASVGSVVVGIAVLLMIFVLPMERLPEFKEYYIPLYEMVKEYFASFSYGTDTLMPVRVYDLLLPTAAVGILGLGVVWRYKNIGWVLFLCGSLFFMTQAYRMGFNFLPHRFVVYLAIPLAILAGMFLVWMYKKIKRKTLAVSIISVILGVSLLYAVSYDFHYTVFVSDKDFESLRWARHHCDGEILSYSTIKKHKEKFEAISNTDVEFKNQLFQTGSIDFKLLQIVSECFSIPITGTASSDTIYYVGEQIKNDNFIRLNRRDRTHTSLAIVRTFWGEPDTVIIADAVEYEQGVQWSMTYHLPVILYAKENYEVVMESIESWRPHVILASEIPELAHVFELKGIPYSTTPTAHHTYPPKEGVALYYNEYDIHGLLEHTSRYLYLSQEATEDYPDLASRLHTTSLNKFHTSGVSAFYLK